MPKQSCSNNAPRVFRVEVGNQFSRQFHRHLVSFEIHKTFSQFSAQGGGTLFYNRTCWLGGALIVNISHYVLLVSLEA